MAIITATSKQFFVIEGLPRSGTTMLAALLNSFDNGFCVPEPLWQLENEPWPLDSSDTRETPARAFPLKDQIKGPWTRETVVDDLKDVLANYDYMAGGFKETYQDWRLQNIDLIDDDKLDFRIFIIRQPHYNFSGWKKRDIHEDLDRFIRNYRKFYKRIEEKGKKLPTYVVKYESLCSACRRYGGHPTCDDPLAYLSLIFEGRLELTGTLLLTPTGYTFGDMSANNSNAVQPARMNTMHLTPHEKKLCTALNYLYDEMPEGLYQPETI